MITKYRELFNTPFTGQKYESQVWMSDCVFWTTAMFRSSECIESQPKILENVSLYIPLLVYVLPLIGQV